VEIEAIADRTAIHGGDAPAAAPAWRASLDLEFARRGARTVLEKRRHDGPLVVQKAFYPEGDPACHVVIVHPPGGIAGGDHLAITASAGAGSSVLLTTPGAARWYRSRRALACQELCWQVGPGACLEWLPQETIFFDDAQVQSAVEVRLSAGARYIGWEVLCFGRAGSGERFQRGRVRLRTRVLLEGRLAWMESARFEGGSPLFQSAAGLAGRTVCGTFVAAGPGLAAIPRDALRVLAPGKGEGAVSGLPDVLLARYLGDSSESAKAYFAALWSVVRPAIAGVPACPPRIWST